MRKTKNDFFEVSYIGMDCSPFEIPSEFIEHLDFTDIIRLPKKDIDGVVNHIKHNYSKFKESEKLVPPGHIIDYYIVGDMKIGMVETLPGVQLRSRSMQGLENEVKKLNLPIAYRVIHRPSEYIINSA